VRATQQRVRLEDDAAAEVIKERARAAAEGMLDRGLECLKRRTRARDYSDALQARVCAAARLGRAPAGRGSRTPPGPKHPSTVAAPAATLRQHRSARQRRPHVAQAQQTAAAVARAGRSLASRRAASYRGMHAAVQPAASDMQDVGIALRARGAAVTNGGHAERALSVAERAAGA